LAGGAAIVLAAGKSTRMGSQLPKVLHEVCGKPMLGYVLEACLGAGVDEVVVVVGYGKEQVIEQLTGHRGVRWVEQSEQKGTGHAVLCCRESMQGFAGSVLVLAGDMPLVREETLRKLVEQRERSGDSLVLATTTLDDPQGYGRIVRDLSGALEAIVEERDCTPAQREIREVNPSYYCFDARRMFESLSRVAPDNAKGEYYITDAVRILRGEGDGVSAMAGAPAEDATGINSREDLALVNRLMQGRIQRGWMQKGVTMIDPQTTWIESDASIGMDSVLYPFTFVGRGARIGSGCRIGPHAIVDRNQTLADGATFPGARRGGGVA